MGDSRKNYLFKTTCNYFDVDIAIFKDLYLDVSLNNFLDDGNFNLLSITYENGKIMMANEMVTKATDNNSLIFCKSKSEVITPDNLKEIVFISSMLDTPISMLYHSVHKVFVPMLLRDSDRKAVDGGGSDFDSKLQNLLCELDAGLGSVIRKSSTSQASVSKNSKKEDDVIGMLSLEDEFQYWSEESSSGTDRKRAKIFADFLHPISDIFTDATPEKLLEGKENVEKMQDVLDDIWKCQDVDKPYPEARMKRLLDVISGDIARFIQKALSSLDLWKGHYPQVNMALRNGIIYCEHWIEISEKLTLHFWKQYSTHTWKGEIYRADNLILFLERFNEILQMRVSHEQACNLLSQNERQQLRVSDTFAPFQKTSSSGGINPLQYNAYTAPLWKLAVGQFDKNMEPIERAIAEKLRVNLKGLANNSSQLLREFERYRELIKRPVLNQLLMNERETLLGQMLLILKQQKESLRNILNDVKTKNKSKNLPEYVSKIVEIRQMAANIENTKKLAADMLDDLSNYKSFNRDSSSLLEEVQTAKQDVFTDWSQEIQAAIENSNLSLETNGRLMELNVQDGHLDVLYSDRLVTLLREVRLLSTMGFQIPAKIVKVTEVGQKFYRHGVVLKNVAQFYNTIDQEMIASQQPMMLESAMAFEKLIKNPKSGSKSKGEGVQVTWDNPEELEAYIQKLQSAAQRLMVENRKLRKCHFTIGDKVVQLMGTDLLRQQQKWKDGLLDIRQIMANLVNQGILPENMRTWQDHWDRQLFKALEHQYQIGLEVLNENLPEIKVELIYLRQKIQFRPPIEEIKAKYYREMKKFIGIPYQFRGTLENVDQATSIFPIIVDRNATGFMTCFNKAAQLFTNLLATMDIFKDWVVLGKLDLDEFTFENLKTINDWEDNFKALKVKGRDVEKLPKKKKVPTATLR